MKQITNIIVGVFAVLALPTVALATGGGVVTYPATNITQTSATISGYVDGGYDLESWMEINTSYSLSYGTQYGHRIGGGPVSATVNNLTCEHRYYFRAVAEDDIGIVEGNVLAFDTLPCTDTNPPPVVNNVAITSFTAYPTQVNSGSNSTLSWSTSYATSCSLSGYGTVAVNSSKSVGPIYNTQSYTLTCYGANNSQDSRTVTVSVISAPPPVVNNVSINSFTAYPQTITSGGSSTLSWTTSYATSCSLSGFGTVAVNSSRVVSPNYTQSYTLTCYGSNGSQDSRLVTVIVNQPVVNNVSVTSFTAYPQTITSGNSSTLSWSTVYATSCSLSGFGTVAVNSSKVVTPNSTQTYTLVCSGSNGSQDSKSVTVTVNQLQNNVVINSFVASPTSITSGNSSTLSWTTSYATNCSLSGYGTVAVNSSRVVTPNTTQTYTLTCTGANGSQDSKTATVLVSQNNVVINSFVASPTTVTNGGNSTLNWTTSNAISCSLSGYGTVDVNGSRSVGPIYGSQSYTLTCTGANGSQDSKTVFVSVTQDQVRIDNFTASPTTVTSGGTTNFYWSSTNANYCTLDGTTVSTSGNRISSPIYSARSFTLYCYGNNGGSDSRTVYVSVYNNQGDYPIISYFSANPTQVPYGGSSTLSWSSNADYCTASGDWSGNKPTSGSQTTGAIYGTRNYTLTCYRNNNQVSQSVSVYSQNNQPIAVDGAITTFATRVTQSSAQLNGIALSSDNRSVDGWFEWGLTQALGNTTQVRYVGNGATNNFSATVSGLSASRNYYFRAVARTNTGTSYGDILRFTTAGTPVVYVPPTVTPRPTPTPGPTTLTFGRPVFMDVLVEKTANDVYRGQEAEFRISYRSLTDRVLQNTLVKVTLPEEFQFVSATKGNYASDNRTLTLYIGDLPPRFGDSYLIRVKVLDDSQVGKTVAVTGYGNYTVPAEGNLQAYQDEVISYVLVTIREAQLNLGAAVGFFDLFNGTLGQLILWLLLLAILLLIIYLLRRLFLSFKEYEQAK